MRVSLQMFKDFIDKLVFEYGDDAYFSFFDMPVPHREYPNEDEQSADAYCAEDAGGLALFIEGNPDGKPLSLGAVQTALKDAEARFAPSDFMHWVFVDASGNLLLSAESLAGYSYRVISEYGDHDISRF